APDREHHIVISAREQKLALLDKGKLVAMYPVSTSKFALSDRPGSYGTPLGEMEIADKIGDGAPAGTVFKDRRRTGEVIPVDAPGRDPIVSRILWLRGREGRNANAYQRDIYIHGTPEERNIGRRASYGCIRMRSTSFGVVVRASVDRRSSLRSR
ncbi:MAG: L,D-transpeptidase family protein, partial [Chthoniobacterales bacterium]